jgi:hypothetical protein
MQITVGIKSPHQGIGVRDYIGNPIGNIYIYIYIYIFVTGHMHLESWGRASRGLDSSGI